MTTRRSFIRNTSIAAFGAMVAPSAVCRAAMMKDKALVGIQLYSVRDDMKKDPMGTLKALSAMGYRNVEHANYVNRKFYGWSAQEFKKVLDDLGMKMPSGHTVLNPKHWDTAAKDFTDAWKWTVEDAAIVGQQFVISPWMDASVRKDYDMLMSTMEMFNRSGALCRKSGMKFGYHNHDFEFSEKLKGETLYDLILNNTDRELVMHQLDIGNLYNGGAKAIDVIRKHPGRFESLHVKDEILSKGGQEKYESTVLGQGIVDVTANLDLAVKALPTVHLIIEQEAYQGKAPLAAMAENMMIMKKWGYKA